MKTTGNDFFNEIQNALFSGNTGNLRVIENAASMEKQIEFLKVSSTLQNYKLPSISEQIELLNSNKVSDKETKIILASLAVSGDVKAYRAIEKYRDTNPGEWADVALMHATIRLESLLSDDRRVFISTGLGGKDGKLRYAAFFKSNRLKNFSKYQLDLIEKEIPYYINRHGGEIEQISTGTNYFTIVFLYEIDGNVRTLLDNTVAECNQYGNFISEEFSITNVKRFSEEDILSELSKKK